MLGRAARAWRINPFVIAQLTEKIFSSPEASAASVMWYLQLSGDLDAWRVIE